MLNCGCEIKYATILTVMNAIYATENIEAWKIQDFSGVWTRDLAIPVRRPNQLRYEATDVQKSLKICLSKKIGELI